MVRTEAGKRFVDAPEVRRISGGAVTLGVDRQRRRAARGGRKEMYGLPQARYDRTDVTEAETLEELDRALAER